MAAEWSVEEDGQAVVLSNSGNEGYALVLVSWTPKQAASIGLKLLSTALKLGWRA